MQERTVNTCFSLKETKNEFMSEVLYLSALHFYRKGRLSLGKAAELAGCTKIVFIEKLRKEKEFVFDYNEEEMDEIFDDAAKLKC
jgi:predicted HTH domain antitoxin